MQEQQDESFDTPEALFGLNLDLTKKKKIPKYYLTNADLLPEVIKSKELGRMTDRLASMLVLLTESYSKKSSWFGYSYREDMVADALLNLCRNALKFDPNISKNPFAYYTQCIKTSFLQYLLDEKKHRYIRDSLLVEAGQNASFSFMDSEKKDSDYSTYSEPGTKEEEQIVESNPYKKKVEAAKARAAELKDKRATIKKEKEEAKKEAKAKAKLEKKLLKEQEKAAQAAERKSRKQSK